MYICRKCKSEINDLDRYCFLCGAYIGEPIEVKDNWQTLNSGINLYEGSSIVEVNESKLINNKLYKIIKQQLNCLFKSLGLLIKSPVNGLNNLLVNYSGKFILALAIMILLAETIVSFFTLMKFRLLPEVSYNPAFMTIGTLFLGFIFSSIIISCSVYLLCFYMFKYRGEPINIGKICTVSNTSLLISITIILIMKISNSLVLITIILIGFMFSLLALFNSINKNLKLDEDKSAVVCLFIYSTYIGSAFVYYLVFVK